MVNSQPYFRLENSSMFDFIRQHQRWMQGILILLILPSFAFFGVQSYTSFMNREPELATVDGSGITLSDFNRARKAQLDQYQSVLGGQFDPATLDTAEMRKQVLNNVIDQKTVALAAEKFTCVTAIGTKSLAPFSQASCLRDSRCQKLTHGFLGHVDSRPHSRGRQLSYFSTLIVFSLASAHMALAALQAA